MVDGKKLLVPIDGSGNSLRALAFVIKRITKDKKLRIYLLNVQLRLPSSLFVSRAMIAEYHSRGARRPWRDPARYWRNIVSAQRLSSESARQWRSSSNSQDILIRIPITVVP